MKFPTKTLNTILSARELFNIKKSFTQQHLNGVISDLSPGINKYALTAYKVLSKFNPDNHGLWTKTGAILDKYSPQNLERETVLMTSDLVGLKPGTFNGYLTSGGTESNIYLAWMGRNKLRSSGTGKTVLLHTDLIHHSILKACNLLDVETHNLKLNTETWSIDLDSFSEEIQNLLKKGYKKFLLPLTLGYTLTGTSDDIRAICNKVRILQNKFKINFYIWIDAAFLGLPLALENKLKYIHKTQVSGIVVDFHKLGFAPLTSSLVLFKNGLEKFVETDTKYLNHKDVTLSGSRSGLAAAACWYTIKALGKHGLKNIINKHIEVKDNFFNRIKNETNLKIIYNGSNLHCGIIYTGKPSQTAFFEKKYGLYFKPVELLFTSGIEKFIISRCFFISRHI